MAGGKGANNTDSSKKPLTASRREKYAPSKQHGYAEQEGKCLGNAKRIFSCLNVFFVICGACILGLAIWTGSGIYKEMFIAGEGYDPAAALAAFGAIVIAVAILGEIGARKDIKCIMLLYFILAFLALLGMLVVGSLNYNGKSELDKSGDEWWDSFDEDLREDVQDEFNCCGYEDSSDRPAADCELAADPADGCRAAFRDFFEEREGPVTALAMAIGACLLASMVLSLRLLCRSTRGDPHQRGQRGLRGAAARHRHAPAAAAAEDYAPFEGKQATALEMENLGGGTSEEKA